MTSFKTLTIQCNNLQQAEDLISDMIASLNANWIYKQDYSYYYAKEVSLDITNVACIESSLIDKKTARIWLIANDHEVKIQNIVPVDGIELTNIEYNSILNLFVNNCIKDVARKHKVNVETSSIFAGKEQALVSEKINQGYSNLDFSRN